MNTLKFRTTVCSECCIRNLANYFSDTKIKYWNGNLNHPLKVLTVEQDDITAEEVIAVVTSAGYEIEEINASYRNHLSDLEALLN